MRAGVDAERWDGKQAARQDESDRQTAQQFGEVQSLHEGRRGWPQPYRLQGHHEQIESNDTKGSTATHATQVYVWYDGLDKTPAETRDDAVGEQTNHQSTWVEATVA